MNILHTLTDLFLPRHCTVCGAELANSEDILCNVCLCNLHWITWNDTRDNPMLRSLWPHHDVEAAGSSFYYNSAYSFRNIFWATKYYGFPRVGEHLARLSFPRWHALGLGRDVDAIIPVPLAAGRRWRRGYNQAEWIARGVATATGIQVYDRILRRIRHNETQTRKNPLQRRENTAGIFAVRKNSPDLNRRTVLLVDDIMTTGATLCDCIRALREAYPSIGIHIYTLGWAGNR